MVFLHARATNNGAMYSRKALQMWATAIPCCKTNERARRSVVCPLYPHIIRRDDPQDLAHHVAETHPQDGPSARAHPSSDCVHTFTASDGWFHRFQELWL